MVSRHLEQVLLSVPTSAYSLHLHVSPIYHAQSPDTYITQHFTQKKRTKASLEEFGNCTIMISHDVPASPVTDQFLHQFCIICVSKGSLHQIPILAFQSLKVDKSQTFHCRITADRNKWYQLIACLLLFFCHSERAPMMRNVCCFF